MFFTFLNKDNSHYPDLSLLLKYTPEEVLFYYYNSYLTISYDTYRKMKLNIEADEDRLSPRCQWIDLIDEELDAKQDLVNFENSEYLNVIGPYYYPFSNTRFYVTRKVFPSQQCITADDFTTIMALEFAGLMDKEIQAYQKTRKNSKRIAKNKEELLKDIEMCLISLKEAEKINKHINYLNKLLELRYDIVDKKQIWPHEPDILPEKPQKEKNKAPINSNLISFSSFKARRRIKEEEDGSSFNQQMKIYLLRYREYEKACDRYKAVLELWEDFCADFLERCYIDIEIAETKLKNAQKNLKIYNGIIGKSFIHLDYQDTDCLTTFKHYLETGRATDLHDCMNLFEEERHWTEIKASQERIENTIYFMQNNDENLRIANGHIESLFKKLTDKAEQTSKV